MAFILFANVTTANTQWLDEDFASLGQAVVNPCSVSGANALVLTPSANLPSVSAYANYQQYSFLAANTNTSTVTATVGSLGALNVYKRTASGPSTLAASDIIAGNVYTLVYNSALNSGAGGFQIDVTSNVTANQTANTIYAGPVSGGAAPPSFRTLVTADLNSVRGQIPGTNTNDSASAGNVGEYLSANTASPGTALTSGTVGTITSLNLTPGDWDVWFQADATGSTLTTVSNIAIGLASVGTLSTVTGFFQNLIGANTTLFNYSANPSLVCGPCRVEVASSLTTLTMYGLAQAVFGASTMSVYGFMRARRVR